MNIKQIIREEMDGLDWIREIQPLSYGQLNNKALEFIPPINNQKYLDHVLNTLRDLGFKVGFNSNTLRDELVIGLFMETNDNVVWTDTYFYDDGSETYQEHINDYAGHEVEVLDGRTLFWSSWNF